MAAAPIRIKLRCKSWAQLKAIYERDLSRSAVFLKASTPPPLGTKVTIDLTLPSGSLIVLNGSVTDHVGAGGLQGRGPGVDIGLGTVPQSAMWLIETALRSAKDKPGPGPHSAGPTQASMEDGAEVINAEDDLIAALKQEFESARRLNPFQVLNCEYNATDPQVRAAFGELTRKYHPDRFARFQSQEARQYASEIFILIRDAYRKLGTETARQQTLQVLQNKPTPTRGTRKAAEAKPSATPARSLGDVRGGPAAAPAFTPRAPSKRAADAEGSQPIDLGGSPGSGGGLAAAEALLAAGEYDNAMRAYQLAARKDPGDRNAKAGIELVEGLRALTVRDRLEAAQRFEAVLELDPNNERAARELAEMRRIATNERKGLLGRLLGKKE